MPLMYVKEVRMEELKLTWKGHSCFTLEESGYTIVLDPYEDGYVPGFGKLRISADEVICSHGHSDHNAVKCVKINKDARSKKNPFRITQIHSFHDEVGGKKRGSNTIHIFDDGKYRVAHMGDLGCPLTAEQIELLKGADVILMPVGGFYTMEPEDVHKLVGELQPRMLVPMHYKGNGFGYDVLAPVEKYLSLCDKSSVHIMDKNTIVLPEDLVEGTVVLKPPVQ